VVVKYLTSPKFQIWALKPTAKKIREYSGSVQAISQDFRRLFRFHFNDGISEILDLETGSVVSKVPPNFRSAEFRSPDRLFMVTANESPSRPTLSASEYSISDQRASDLLTIDYTGFVPGSSPITRLANDGRELFVFQSKTNTVEVWDLDRREKVRELTLPDLKVNIFALGFEVDSKGTWLTIADLNSKKQRIFNALSGKEVPPSANTMERPTFVPGRNVLMGSGLQKTFMTRDYRIVTYRDIWAYDFDQKTVIGSLRGNDHLYTLSGDGKSAVTWNFFFSPGSFRLWDLSQIP
jgi:WD40 repeat protein